MVLINLNSDYLLCELGYYYSHNVTGKLVNLFRNTLEDLTQKRTC